MKTIFIFIAALLGCQGTRAASTPQLQCQGEQIVECLDGACAQSEAPPFELTFRAGRATLDIGSLELVDNRAELRRLGKGHGFALLAKGKAVGGELVQVSAAGLVTEDLHLQAIVNGSLFLGSCQQR